MIYNHYKNHKLENSDLPIIFHTDTALSHKENSIYANWHSNIEILCFICGFGEVLSDSVLYQVTEGDIFLCLLVYLSENHSNTDIYTTRSSSINTISGTHLAT